MADGEPNPPPMIWAQRSDLIYLTVILEDIIDPIVTYQEDSVYFKGSTKQNDRIYEVRIVLFNKINPEKCKTVNRERCVEMILMKKNTDEPYWPYLTQDKKKHHWLKVDFNKWRDEEDSNDEQEENVSDDIPLDAYDDIDEEEDGEEETSGDEDLSEEKQVLHVEAE